MNPDEDLAPVENFEAIELVNGTPGCVECGGLLCVEHRERPISGTRQIGYAMLPRPVADVERIQCAGCGTTLWERE